MRHDSAARITTPRPSAHHRHASGLPAWRASPWDAPIPPHLTSGVTGGKTATHIADVFSGLRLSSDDDGEWSVLA